MTAPDPGLVAAVAVMFADTNGPDDVARAAATWLADKLVEIASGLLEHGDTLGWVEWSAAAGRVREWGGVS